MLPSAEQLALLRRFERFSFRFCDFINRHEGSKRATGWFLRHIGAGWVWPSIKNLLVVDGIERVRALQPPGGVLLVSNHRSLFDMYVTSCVLFRQTNLLERIYFPVRSEFFYERPLGLLVNGIMSAWAMYPPILRQPARSEFNRYAMGRLVELLSRRGNIVGFHPEGTRNRTNDPYTLLPAQPGVGQLILQARPTVLPVFIHGLSNSIGSQIRSNLNRTGSKVIVVFGAPLELDHFLSKPARLRTYMEIARAVRSAITDLGQRERLLRHGGEASEFATRLARS